MVSSGTRNNRVGQSRPLDSPFAHIRDHPLLSWAHHVGLIKVYADGSWHLSELALEWLRHQPVKIDNSGERALGDVPRCRYQMPSSGP